VISIYGAFFKLETSIKAHYRFNMAIWLLGLMVEPVVYMVVWINVAQARGGVVESYTASDFVVYYLAFIFVRQMGAAPSPYRFARRIQTGEMSMMLLRPVHPVHGDIAETTSQKLMSLPILLVMAGVLGLAFHVVFSPPLWSAILFPFAVVLAASLRFSMQWTLATTAFWTTRLDAVWQIYIILQTFLSGALAPLPLLPPVIRSIADVLPFRWVFYFPIELMLGRLSPIEALQGFAIQGVWLLILILLLQLVWRVGIRHYSAVGG
jgi:ABC-2 type transport system permease protein